jgi:hypothetical protein
MISMRIVKYGFFFVDRLTFEFEGFKYNFFIYIVASTETVRSCPLCRTFSPYVIPSTYFVKSKYAVDRIIFCFLHTF